MKDHLEPTTFMEEVRRTKLHVSLKEEHQILQSLQYANLDPCMLVKSRLVQKILKRPLEHMEEGIEWPLVDTVHRCHSTKHVSGSVIVRNTY